MKVELFVTLDATDDSQQVWWATAPSVGNLAVAASSLRELEVIARDAVLEVVEDRAVVEPVDIQFTLVNRMPPTSSNDVVTERDGELSVPATAGPEGQSRARQLVSAA